MNNFIRIKTFPLAEETSKIINAGLEIYKGLGFGFLEVVYKDAFEYEFKMRSIEYEREKKYKIKYKDTILPHQFNADFVVFQKVVLEIKAKTCIAEEDEAQTINYLKCSGCKVGLILNFGRSKLDIKRMVF